MSDTIESLRAKVRLLETALDLYLKAGVGESTDFGIQIQAYDAAVVAFGMGVPPVQPDGWIEWEGGANPVPGQMVAIRTRSSEESDDAMFSECFYWKHDGDECDITSYKVVS